MAKPLSRRETLIGAALIIAFLAILFVGARTLGSFAQSVATADSNDVGTLADWFTIFATVGIGVLAAGFGALAWQEARLSNTWAAKAVASEARTQRLMELELATKVEFTLGPEATTTNERTKLESLVLTLSDASPGVWIKNVETVTAIGRADPQPVNLTNDWKASLRTACSAFEGWYIARGPGLSATWASESPDAVDPYDAIKFAAVIRITYTVTDDAEASEFLSPTIIFALPSLKDAYWKTS